MLEGGAILSFGDYSKHFSAVSAHNATDKMPMYEMPLIFVFGVLGLGRACFYIGVLGDGILSLAFCPEMFFGNTSQKCLTIAYCREPPPL